MAAPLCFFLHIPKTAGTTLNEVLRANHAPEAVLDVYDQPGFARLAGLRREDLERIRLVQGHCFVADFDALLDGPIPVSAVTFLRDPLARVVSEYHFLRSWPRQSKYEIMRRADLSLEEFVATDIPELRHHGKNLMTKSLCGAKDQDSDEAMLERAWANLSQRLAMFGLIERFEASMLLLGRAWNLETVFFERRNVNPDRPDPEALPQATREAIEAHNKLDRELHSRALALFDRRVAKLGPGFKREMATFRMLNERFQSMAAKLHGEQREVFKDFVPDQGPDGQK